MKSWRTMIVLLVTALFVAAPAWADDTCIFTVTADSIPPNVLILLDNGAEMENVVWHSSYNDSTKWDTQWYWDPLTGIGTQGSGCDASKTGPDWNNLSYLNEYGDGGYLFCNPTGYAMSAGYLRPVKSDLSLDTTRGLRVQADGSLRTPVLLNLYSYTYKYYKVNGVAQAGYPYTYSDIPAGKTISVGTPVAAVNYSAAGAVTHVSNIKWPVAGDPFNDPDGDGYYVSSGSYDDGTGNIVTYEYAYNYTYHYVMVQETSAGLFTNAYDLYEFGSGGSRFQQWTWVDTWYRKIVKLPQVPSAVVDADGIKDNATLFRFGSNYLNWIFRSWMYTGDGTDLPAKSRFYYAKKAIRDVAKLTSNKSTFGVNTFSSTSVGASNVQPLKAVVTTVNANPALNVLDPNFVNTINNLGTVTYSPLAEGLADVGGVYAGKSVAGYVSDYYCQKNFNIVVSAGLSSKDTAPGPQGVPSTLKDEDGDNAAGGIGEGNIKVNDTVYTIPTRLEGSTYLDDVAHYLHTHDIIGYRPGFQNLTTYTVGVMTSAQSRAFLINTSNNGNGNYNLYNTADPEYGRYHFEATSPDGLTAQLLAALNSILSRTSTFTAPVVPVTRTTSGDLIYLAFFKPLNNNNFWEGNVTKFLLGAGNDILDKDGDPATWPNGAMRDDAEPVWATKNWGDSSKPNFIAHTQRNIYTFLGSNTNLSDASNAFVTTNAGLTAPVLGNPAKTNAVFPAVTAKNLLISYIRGADSFDIDKDNNISETRLNIHGDVLHGEPVVIAYGSAATPARMVYFAANDGMLHAVNDSDGKEAWGFIPPDQLHRLLLLTEGVEHPYFIDSSPKVFLDDKDGDGYIDASKGDVAILICGERGGGKSYFALDVSNPAAPVFLWRMTDHDDRLSGTFRLNMLGGAFANGEVVRGGATGAEALVNGTLSGGVFLAFKGRSGTFAAGETLAGLTSGATASLISVTHNAPPQDTSATLKVVSGFGETWSEPVFTRVITSDAFNCTGSVTSSGYKLCLANNTDKWASAFIIGGGYSEQANVGNFVLIAKVSDGSTIKKITHADMTFGIPSSLTVIDANSDRFADKVYVGDLGGQLWRIGKFDVDYRLDVGGSPLPLTFPNTNQKATDWVAARIFSAGCDDGTCGDNLDSDGDFLADERRRFFYAPDVTLEFGYDLLLVGSGDRENACNAQTNNRIYAIKDNHVVTNLTEASLINAAVTTPRLDIPYLHPDPDNPLTNINEPDKGFYLPLPAGDKVLSKGVTFYRVFYATVFSPTTTDPCVPGGVSFLYSVAYKTGAAGADLNGDGTKDLATLIGGGIGSRPVVIIREGEEVGIIVAVGSTNPEAVDSNSSSASVSESQGAGIPDVTPPAPAHNFDLLWWKSNN